jgi:hypothetical protein
MQYNKALRSWRKLLLRDPSVQNRFRKFLLCPMQRSLFRICPAIGPHEWRKTLNPSVGQPLLSSIFVRIRPQASADSSIMKGTPLSFIKSTFPELREQE